MAIGTTGSVDPETGERVETQFNYTPVDPQEDMMRQAFQQSQQAFFPPPPQPQGPTPYWEDPSTYYPRQRQIDPIEQAKASTAAAYKYIAMRGYQQDLKEGKSAAESFAKWGPMLVQDTSLAPAMKAFQPPPQWRFNKETRAYEPQGGAGRPYFQPGGAALRPDVNPEENVRLIGNRKVYVNPRTGSMQFLDDKANEWDKIDYTTASAAAKGAQEKLNNPTIMTDERTAAEKTLKDATDRMNEIKAPKQSSAPPAPTVIRLTKDGKKAEFDTATKKFLRYAD